MTKAPLGRAHLHLGIPLRARTLIWDVFFQSRGRGKAFEDHLPWAAQADTRSLVIDSGEAETADATLVLRPSLVPQIGMIGFVCVREGARGLSLSLALLEGAAAAARGTFESLLLWTGKARVYEAAGFTVSGRDTALEFTIAPGSGTIGFESGSWPQADGPIGLPPFASSGGVARCDGGSLAYVLSDEAATVMDWTGMPDVVTRLIASVRPGKWYMSVGDDDPLEQRLSRLPVDMVRRPGALTMLRNLRGAANRPGRIPLLHRI